VRITVQHQLGGGATRVFEDAGDTDTPVPPTAATVCADAGMFEVKKDTFDYDGVATDCTSVMASLGGGECQEVFGEMFACMRFAGGCSIFTDGMSGTTTHWDSGARMVIEMDYANPIGDGIAMTGYDPEGNLCFTGGVGNVSEDNASATYTDAQGNKFKITTNGDNTIVECPGGKKFEMTGEEAAAMNACQSQQGQDSCTMEGYGFCGSATDCDSDEICCDFGGGIAMCYSAEICAIAEGTQR